MNNRLTELILYIAEKSRGDPAFGATKLNKILFLVDFFAYGFWGNSITGATYKRLRNGPVPHELPIAKNILLSQGRAEEILREYYGRPQKRLVPISGSDCSLFTREEITLVDQVIKECSELNATNLSDWSHQLKPWLLSKDGEEIPYETIFILRDTPVSSDDISWAEAMTEQLLDNDHV